MPGRAGGVGRPSGATATGLVSGEAVVLELRPASFASRGLALLLDLIIMISLASVFGTVVAMLGALIDEAAMAALALVATVTAVVILPVTFETLSRGRSLGKMALGLRVVRDDGGPVRFRQALVRGLLLLVEVLALPYLSLISSVANARGKRLGDHLAGTYVIRDRSDGAWSPAPMAPQLARWAAAADVGHLPDPLVAAARTYLSAVPHLAPDARAELARGLADDLVRHVQPAPPPGTDPHAFVSSVLAERRRRDLIRLQRQADVAHGRRLRRAQAGVLSPVSSRLVGSDRAG